MPKHLDLAELKTGLLTILASPKDEGVLRAIVVRPAPGERRDLASSDISLARGVHGDHWEKAVGNRPPRAARIRTFKSA